MFNLIVRSEEQKEVWDREDSFLAVVPEELRGAPEDPEKRLEMVWELPTVIVGEFLPEDTEAVAYLGYLNGPSRSATIAQALFAFPANELFNVPSLGNLVSNRNQWRVVSGDPFELIPGARQKYRENTKKLAVMMPIGNENEPDVLEVIKSAAGRAGYSAIRVDEFLKAGHITDDILNLLETSEGVIADLTDQKPNVLYEVGYAHGQDKPTILISADDLAKLPFDIKDFRTLGYSREGRRLREFSEKLTSCIRQTFHESKGL